MREAVQLHYAFVWRTLRRFGAEESEADDATQEVFLILSKKLGTVEPGGEKRFLFHTAVHLSQHARRARLRRRETTEEALEQHSDPSPTQEDTIDAKRARELLADVLDAMPDDLRAVLVLCDIEQTTMVETARLLDLAPGTVASRLRRARESFASLADEARKRCIRQSPRRGGS
jgi:RNA polymerase sigma-70 factor (ECF subfamily)